MTILWTLNAYCVYKLLSFAVATVGLSLNSLALCCC